MKKRSFRGSNSAKFTKSDKLTMETIPNCTNLRDVFERKIKQNQLQVRFFCDILKQNKRKTEWDLYNSILILSLHELI